MVAECNLPAIIRLHEQLYASVLRERNDPEADRLDAPHLLT